MGKTKIMELNEFGQSIWLDYISRSLIETGTLNAMIDQGLRGMTSNPTIFDKAISSGAGYDKKIIELYRQNKSIFEIYDDLTVRDIQDAADIFRPVYENTQRLDGYVSLEINPQLAFDTDETIKEGKRLHKKVARPNVMLKVPSTEEGFTAVEELTASGINVNVTLIFFLDQYRKSAEAYLRGIERFIENGGEARNVRSVASAFISRIDTAVDKLLDNKKGAAYLKGKAAVANTALIYAGYLKIFSQDAFRSLTKKGAAVQRVLWGSTSTKNPGYSDIKYVSELICKDSVNTVPQNTFEAFMDHGIIKAALTGDAAGAQKIISGLKRLDIDVDKICAQLLEDGVAAFTKSFESLLRTIEKKAKELCHV